MKITDKNTGVVTEQDVKLERDECNRPNTNPEDLSGLNPVIENGSITPGNASQLSDGASACIVMDS